LVVLGAGDGQERETRQGGQQHLHRNSPFVVRGRSLKRMKAEGRRMSRRSVGFILHPSAFILMFGLPSIILLIRRAKHVILIKSMCKVVRASNRDLTRTARKESSRARGPFRLFQRH